MTDPRLEDEIFTVIPEMSVVLSFGSPLHEDPWGVGVTEDMVQECLARRNLLGPEPIEFGCRDPMKHAARIAWLCVHGWHDPIVFSAGLPNMGILPERWRFIDGNHRLAAAEIMGMTHIAVVIDGDMEAGMADLQSIPLCSPEDF